MADHGAGGGMVTTVKAACPHDCPDTCALEVTVENGVAVQVRGGAMPFTGGTLCTKVARYLDRTYSKERLLHPLRRIGAKGPGGRFERISWDEALDEIAARFMALAADDPHPSALGHRILADVIAEHLERSGLLDRLEERAGG